MQFRDQFKERIDGIARRSRSPHASPLPPLSVNNTAARLEISFSCLEISPPSSSDDGPAGEGGRHPSEPPSPPSQQSIGGGDGPLSHGEVGASSSPDSIVNPV